MAHKYNVDEIAEYIGVDSLAYISVDGLYRATGKEGRDAKTPQYCDACFTGDYPVELVDHNDKQTGANVTSLRERNRS